MKGPNLSYVSWDIELFQQELCLIWYLQQQQQFDKIINSITPSHELEENESTLH